MLTSATVGDCLDLAPIQVLSLSKPFSFNARTVLKSSNFHVNTVFQIMRAGLDLVGRKDNVSGLHGPVRV